MKGNWEKLASRAVVAALVVAPPGGPEFELLYLDAEPDKSECRGLSAKGWSPVLLFAWTKDGLRFESDPSLLKWPPSMLIPFVRTVSLAFLAGVNQMLPADRIRAN